LNWYNIAEEQKSSPELDIEKNNHHYKLKIHATSPIEPDAQLLKRKCTMLLCGDWLCHKHCDDPVWFLGEASRINLKLNISWKL